MEVHRVTEAIHSRHRRHSRGTWGLRWGWLCVLWSLGSCTAPRPPLVVTDPDPSVKIPAIEKAVRLKDRGALPQLVKDLDSDDPAVRFYANHALEQLTGQNFGYRYFDDESRREPASQKWRQWLIESSAASHNFTRQAP